ncbi:universal stress protein [Halobacterium litoreum]|uniref:Universal stress protein n=1 Tax=Halobacterium litoreum TaxID=2039234 RepID=A0ABD5NF54_9EURY|nr:universal stress protein [Halobacterium litoreum]UHH13213.1 universal stress protein [Halobacterium litoreum]
MFDRILVPVDGSACALRAAKYGVELAAAFDAAVDVLHVDTGDVAPADVLAAVEGLAADRAVATHTATGNPRKRIVAFARERDADLVVMGRHGRRGVGERVLGSTTERVLRSAPAPVFTVAGEGVTDDLGTTYDDVLLPTDGSENALAAASHAAAVAARFDATVHVVAVVDVQREGGVFGAGGVDRSFVERLESRAAERVDAASERVTDREDVRVRRAVRRGHPSEALCEYAADEGVDLVAMGSAGSRSLAARYLGSVTDRVLRRADAPVLVVPADR